MKTEPQPGDTTPTDRERPGDAGKLNAGEGTRGPDKRAGDSAPRDRASAREQRENAEAAEDRSAACILPRSSSVAALLPSM